MERLKHSNHVILDPSLSLRMTNSISSLDGSFFIARKRYIVARPVMSMHGIIARKICIIANNTDKYKIEMRNPRIYEIIP